MLNLLQCSVSQPLGLTASISQWHIGRVSYSVVQDAKNPSAIFNCGPAAISCNRMAAKHGVVHYHQCSTGPWARNTTLKFIKSVKGNVGRYLMSITGYPITSSL